MRSVSLVALTTLVASVAFADAATVAPLQGAVTVNVGTGFKPIVGSRDVAPGDRVLVAEGGKAQIRFSPTCAAEIKPGLYTVPKDPVCGGGGLSPGLVLGGVVAVGATTAVIITSTQDDKPASP